MSEQMIGVYPTAIVSLHDIHNMSIDESIDESLKAIKMSLKLCVENIINNRKYPVEYELDGVGTLIIEKDGRSYLRDEVKGDL